MIFSDNEAFHYVYTCQCKDKRFFVCVFDFWHGILGIPSESGANLKILQGKCDEKNWKSLDVRGVALLEVHALRFYEYFKHFFDVLMERLMYLGTTKVRYCQTELLLSKLDINKINIKLFY